MFFRPQRHPPSSKLLLWRSITVALLLVGYAGYYVCRSNLSVVDKLISADLERMGDASAGLAWMGVTPGNFTAALASLGIVFYALGKFTSGPITEFVGGRNVFLFGMAASIGCTVLFGLSGGMLTLLIVWCVNRYVQAMGWGGLMKTAARWFPPEQHGRIMGVLCLSYLFGDFVARRYLGLLLRWNYSWRELFFGAAAALGGILLLNLFLLRDSPQAIGEEEPHARDDSPYGAAADQTQPATLWALLAPLLLSTRFWFACVINMGLTIIRETFNFWTPRYFQEVVQFSPSEAADASGYFPLAGGCASLLLGFLSDRLGGRREKVVVPSLVGLVAALALLSCLDLQGQKLLAVVLVSLVSFFLLGPYTFMSGVVSLDLGGKQGSATASNLIDTAGYGSAALISGFAVKMLAERYGWSAAFWTLTGIALATLAAGVLSWLSRESPPGK